MTDLRLRDAERRFHALGTIEAEAAFMHERLRLGRDSWSRVQTAAYLDHEPSRLLLSQAGVPVPPLLQASALHGWTAKRRWKKLVRPLSQAALVDAARAALAIGIWRRGDCAGIAERLEVVNAWCRADGGRDPRPVLSLLEQLRENTLARRQRPAWAALLGLFEAITTVEVDYIHRIASVLVTATSLARQYQGELDEGVREILLRDALGA